MNRRELMANWERHAQSVLTTWRGSYDELTEMLIVATQYAPYDCHPEDRIRIGLERADAVRKISLHEGGEDLISIETEIRRRQSNSEARKELDMIRRHYDRWQEEKMRDLNSRIDAVFSCTVTPEAKPTETATDQPEQTNEFQYGTGHDDQIPGTFVPPPPCSRDAEVH